MTDFAAPSATTLQYLSQLVGFDTTSRNSNIALIEWAAQILADSGASLTFDYNDDKSKANLVATYGSGAGGLVFSGHTDVVPVDGQHWDSDPFVADVRNGKVYGRGTCDMKGFIAVVLSHAKLFGAARLTQPIHVALSYDEEVGCLGIPHLLANMKDKGIQPSGCIVGEPTSMRLIGSHKGGQIYRCTVKGCSAHSSLTPQGVNAIEFAAKIISHIRDLADQEAESGLKDSEFDVPFSTISTNTILGGSAKNIIPSECEFYFDFRHLPGIHPDSLINAVKKYASNEVLPRMQKTNRAARIDFECIGSIPALDTKANEQIFQLACSLLGETRAGKVAYGTEGSFFQEAGIPTVVCGPGSIEQAHKPNEYVALDQLAICENFIGKIFNNSIEQ